MTFVSKLKWMTAAAALAATGSAMAAVAFNDGFETPSIGSAPYVTYNAPGTFNGWTVSGGSVDIVSNSWQPSIQAYEGSQFLDLAGTSPGAVSRTLSLSPGTYSLSFNYRANTFDPNPIGGSYAALAVAGVGLQTPYYFSAPANNSSWLSGSLQFTATSPNTLLAFTSLATGANGNGGVLLDNVQVAAVPEPAEWAMMVAGLGLVGAAARRKRARR